MKEEEREVVMARYGAEYVHFEGALHYQPNLPPFPCLAPASIEMNTNLFLEPELARADMDIKVNHQKKVLEDKLTELGLVYC